MSAPPRAIVVGMGFAGVAAAVDLASRGARVTIVEARRSGGGRAASYPDPESGETIDNGQHVLMGCYSETRSLLRLLGTERLVRFQKRLALDMIEENGRVVRLASPPLPAPLHLLGGLLAWKGLTWSDRLALLRAALGFGKPPSDDATVESWLDTLGQTENLRERFWRPLAIAAINEDTKLAAGSLLFSVLEEFRSGGAAGSAIGIAAAGLSDLYVEPARRFVRERGGELLMGAPAEEVLVAPEKTGMGRPTGEITAAGTTTRESPARGRVAGVRLRDGTVIEGDAVVLAVPHTAAAALLPAAAREADPRLSRLAEMGSSAIVSVNLWFDRSLTPLGFFGFIGGTVQWVFNKERLWDPALAKGRYLACVVSAASALATSDNGTISAAAEEEIRRRLPSARGARLLRSMVVREKLATFSGTPASLRLRPGAAMAVANLAIAGDWTDTGLPATIEGAVRSGRRAARIALPDPA